MLDPLSMLNEETNSTEEFQESIQEIPRETLWPFLLAVLLAQVGLFALSLGLMLIVFRNQWTIGSLLFFGGMFAVIATVGVYLYHRKRS